jgi:hypothetical protein
VIRPKVHAAGRRASAFRQHKPAARSVR